MNFKKPTTMKDIAAEAGTSIMTVSKVLRGVGGISNATCDQINKIAKEMNYTPDPYVNALNTYRSSHIKRVGWETLGIITASRSNSRGNMNPMTIRLHEETIRAAKIHGFTIEEQSFSSDTKSLLRILKAFYRKGIRGILLLPSQQNPDFSWTGFSRKEIQPLLSNFSIITCLAHPLQTPFSNVFADTYYNARLAYRKLKEKGYRRIGFILEQAFHQISDGSYLAGYVTEMSNDTSLPSPIHPCIVEKHDPIMFFEWYNKEQLDCCLTIPGKLMEVIDEHSPKSLSKYRFCSVSSGKGYRNTGVYSDLGKISEEAVKLLSQQMSLGIKGIPETAVAIALRGCWNEGITA